MSGSLRGRGQRALCVKVTGACARAFVRYLQARMARMARRRFIPRKKRWNAERMRQGPGRGGKGDPTGTLDLLAQGLRVWLRKKQAARGRRVRASRWTPADTPLPSVRRFCEEFRQERTPADFRAEDIPKLHAQKDFRALVAVIRAKLESAVVVEAALAVLGNLVAGPDGPDNIAPACRAGAIKATLEAMRQHTDDREVAWRACKVLGGACTVLQGKKHVTQQATVRGDVVKHGGVALLRAAAETFQGDEEIEKSVLETLKALGALEEMTKSKSQAAVVAQQPEGGPGEALDDRDHLAPVLMTNGSFKRVEELCAGDEDVAERLGALAAGGNDICHRTGNRGGTEPPPDTHADQAPAAGVGGGQTAALPRASSAQSWKILYWKGQIFVRLNQAALAKTVTQADGSRVRTGVTKTLEVSSADSVLSVKKQLQQLQLQGAAGRLLFAGKELPDDATLAEYSVSRGSTLDALPRCRGAGGGAAPVAAASAQNQQHAPPSRVELQLGHSGLGLFIAKEGPGPFVITRLIPGGAAALSGQMGVGDLLHAIGTTSLYELGDQQAKALIRGTPGPGVTLWIARAQAHLDSTPRNIGPAAQVRLKKRKP